MALIKCGECGDVMSNKADKCPKCGAPAKKKTSLFTWIVAILFSLWFFPYILSDDALNDSAGVTDSILRVTEGEHYEKNPVYASDFPKGAEKLEIDCRYGAELMGEDPVEIKKLYTDCIQNAGGTVAPLPDLPTKTSATPYKPTQKWGAERVAAAKEVMALSKKICNIFEDGTFLVVEMQTYIDDRNKLLQFVRSIADADVVLHGETRSIWFYDPSKKKIAKADPYKGVRLVD